MNFVLHIFRSFDFFRKLELPSPCVSLQGNKNVEGSGVTALVVLLAFVGTLPRLPASGYSPSNLPEELPVPCQMQSW